MTFRYLNTFLNFIFQFFTSISDSKSSSRSLNKSMQVFVTKCANSYFKRPAHGMCSHAAVTGSDPRSTWLFCYPCSQCDHICILFITKVAQIWLYCPSCSERCNYIKRWVLSKRIQPNMVKNILTTHLIPHYDHESFKDRESYYPPPRQNQNSTPMCIHSTYFLHILRWCVISYAYWHL